MPIRRDLAVAAMAASATLIVCATVTAGAETAGQPSVAPVRSPAAASPGIPGKPAKPIMPIMPIMPIKPIMPLMRSRVFDSPKIKPEPTKVGERREVFDAPTATLERLASHITTLNAGQAPHPAHKHPEEELMILKEGTLEVTLNGQTTRVEPGGMIFCASNEMHGLRNVGTTPATYYVVKWFPHDLAKDNLAKDKTTAPGP